MQPAHTPRLALDGVFQPLAEGDEGEVAAGAGDGRIEQFTAEDGAVFRGKDEDGVGKLRALRLVDGHGPGAFGVVEAAGEDGTGGVFAIGEVDAQAFIRVGQGDADVAIAETEVGIIAGDEGGAANIPKAAALQDALALQIVFDGAVDAGNAPGALAQGTEDAEASVVVEDGFNPCAMLLLVFRRRLARSLPDATIGAFRAGKFQYLVDGGGGLPGEGAGVRSLQYTDGAFWMAAMHGIR